MDYRATLRNCLSTCAVTALLLVPVGVANALPPVSGSVAPQAHLSSGPGQNSLGTASIIRMSDSQSKGQKKPVHQVRHPAPAHRVTAPSWTCNKQSGACLD
jgi:hypothetical protein